MGRGYRYDQDFATDFDGDGTTGVSNGKM